MKKTEFKKILVPIDFTETANRAMDEAIKLSKLIKAELFLIHVIEYGGYIFSVVPSTPAILPSMLDLGKAVDKKMDTIKQEVKRKHGITPKVCITTGHIHAEIIDFSKKKKIDLIIMGTHGASGFKETFIGSNAQRVVTLSDIPVLTIQKKKKEKLGFKCILVPIDNSLHSREKVNIAISIANIYGAKIHLIGLIESNDKKEVNEIKHKLESVEKIAKSYEIPFKSAVVKGKHLAKIAMNYATKNKCDLIIINTGHESEVTGIFLGALAQQIVNHSKIPVLTWKHTDGRYSINTPGYGIG